MRIVCIHTDLHGRQKDLRITVGKTYTVISQDDQRNYIIKNDDGIVATYWRGRFESLDVVREKRLEELGI